MSYEIGNSDTRLHQSVEVIRMFHHIIGFSLDEIAYFARLPKQMITELLLGRAEYIDYENFKNLLFFYGLALKNVIKRGQYVSAYTTF